MSRRPRQHVLEDESLLAFQSALPARWIFRRGEKDYGIDGSVEVVDAPDKVTGKIFFVQLKATDDKRDIVARRVRLKRKALEYYKSLDLPVLIVRYHSAEHVIYARWAFDLDAYYAKGSGASRTFALGESDRWHETTHQSLAVALDDWRWLTAPTLEGPLVLRLELPLRGAFGASAADLSAAIQHRIRKLARLLRIDELGVGARGTIRVSDDLSVVLLPAGKACTLHTPSPLRLSPDEVACNLILSIAVALDRAGHKGAAADIALASARGAAKVASSALLPLVSAAIVNTGRINELLDLAIDFAIDGRSLDFLASISGAVFLAPATASDRWNHVADRLERLVSVVERAWGGKASAVTRYNVGHLISSKLNDHRRAFKHYHAAFRGDVRYKQRAHAWADLGAAAFVANRFTWAAKAYERALELGAANDTRARMADALLHSGRFADAETAFEVYQSQTDHHAYWLLGRYVAATVRNASGGGRCQRRDNAAARALMTTGALVSSERMIQVLHADAITPSAWFNLGLCYAHTNEHADAFSCFVVASFLCVNDLEAWANAILSALNARVDERLGDLPALVVATAAARFGGALYRQLVDQVNAVSPEHRSDLNERIRLVLAAIPPDVEKRVLRLLHEDGAVAELDVSQRAGQQASALWLDRRNARFLRPLVEF